MKEIWKSSAADYDYCIIQTWYHTKYIQCCALCIDIQYVTMTSWTLYTVPKLSY